MQPELSASIVTQLSQLYPDSKFLANFNWLSDASLEIIIKIQT